MGCLTEPVDRNRMRSFSTDVTSFFDMDVDNRLTFASHICYLQLKLSRSMGIISKIKYYGPDRVLFLQYFAIFHSHLTYGLIIWCSTYKMYTSKISK